jgi:TonB family protein
MTPGAHAQTQTVGQNPGPQPAAIHFDVPAQPLAAALQAYGHAAKLSVLIDSSLLAARTSASVAGDYSPHEALERLLEDTGLQVTFTSANAAIIVASPASMHPPAAEVPSGLIAASAIDGLDGDASYAAHVQSRLDEALCGSPLTRPGHYRVVVQLRIGESGSVVASKVIDSTGDTERDEAIARAARDLSLDAGPPATLQQPVTILLRPLGNGVMPDCPPLDGRG